MILVDDPGDHRLVPFGLTDRQLRRHGPGGRGWFLTEGDLVTERALAAGCRPVAALVDPDRPPTVASELGTTVYGAGDAVRRAVTHLGVVQPVLALFERPAPADLDGLLTAADRLVVVEGVDNPSNVGAIVRNAAALGWDGLVLDEASADPLARRSLRVAMGTAFTLPFSRCADIVALVGRVRAAGVTTYALTPADGAVDVDAVLPAGRRAVVLGAERAGLTPEVLAACDARVGIPLAPGVDSLNVAAATAIACHRLR